MAMLMAWYEEHAEAVEVAVVGSSYTYHSFDLNSFCRPAVNFSLYSQDLFQSRAMLEKALHAPACALKRVLVGLAPWSFESDTSFRPQRWSYQWNYAPLVQSMHHIPVSYATIQRLCKPAFLQLLSARTLDLNDVVQLRHRYLSERDFVHAPLKRIQAKRGACAWNEKQYPSTRREMEGELRKILELCAAHGAEPVLLITPFTAFYRCYLSPRLLASFRESLAEVVQGRQVRVLDYYARPEFDEADFLDEQHLNAHGALKMTHLLNHDLYGVETPLPSAWHGRMARIAGDCRTVTAFLWNVRAGRELADVHLRPFDAARQPERPVVIYGAGQDGRKLFQKLREAGIPEEDILFCDTYHAGAVVEGKTVLSPDEIQCYPEAPILISSAKYGSSIYDGLTARGIGDERLFYDP